MRKLTKDFIRSTNYIISQSNVNDGTDNIWIDNNKGKNSKSENYKSDENLVHFIGRIYTRSFNSSKRYKELKGKGGYVYKDEIDGGYVFYLHAENKDIVGRNIFVIGKIKSNKKEDLDWVKNQLNLQNLEVDSSVYTSIEDAISKKLPRKNIPLSKSDFINKYTIGGTILGGTLGLGASRLITKSLRSRIKVLNNMSSLSKKDSQELKLLKLKLINITAGSTLSGGIIGGGLGYYIGQYKKFNSKPKNINSKSSAHDKDSNYSQILGSRIRNIRSRRDSENSVNNIEDNYSILLAGSGLAAIHAAKKVRDNRESRKVRSFQNKVEGATELVNTVMPHKELVKSKIRDIRSRKNKSK